MANSLTRRLHRSVHVAILPLVLAGCQWGMNLRPPGWTQDGWYGQWGDLEDSCDGVTSEVRHHSGSMEIIVRNRSARPCVLREAPLIAGGRTYPGKLNSRQDPVRVSPEFYEKCSLSWEFEDRISRVCAEGCIVLLRFECDGAPREIRLELKTPPVVRP